MNYYPELPYQPYRKTSIEMGAVIDALKKFDVSREVKISCYVIFRNESGNGRSGINNNYIGAQADASRWPDSLNQYITGWTKQNERMTGKERLFLTFADVSGSLAFLIDRIKSRGLFVGGYCNVVANMFINDPSDWVTAYWISWVTGNKKATVPDGDRKGLLSIYHAGKGCFR